MLLVLNALTKAELVRRPENPLPRLLLPLLQSVLPPDHIGWGTWPPVLLPSCQLDSRWRSGHPTSSRLAGLWPRVVSSFGWGSCTQSV
jgi:hypothetical protein